MMDVVDSQLFILGAKVEELEQEVAVNDLQEVLNGGTVQIAGFNVHLLGLKNARTIIEGTIANVPPLRSALKTAALIFARSAPIQTVSW